MLLEPELNALRTKLVELHEQDASQLDAVFSNSMRTLVEAPAGYGKTKTIISKIAYLLSSGGLRPPKKVLALTFSVNAAFKMKQDVLSQIPKLLDDATLDSEYAHSILVSNYHGFCRRVLSKYGYLIREELRNLNSLAIADDSHVQSLVDLGIGIDSETATQITLFSDAIKNADLAAMERSWDFYIYQVVNQLLPNGFISYNAIIALVIHLLRHNREIMRFYHSYLPIIFVDEFQDTNYLSWKLLQLLISNETRLILVGDPLQRIYGFIGAIPNIMELAQVKYDMDKITLKNNHRFRNNYQILLLERNIRKNAENPRRPSVEEECPVNFHVLENQCEEAEFVLATIQEILSDNPNVRIAVLVKQRGNNIESIMNTLSSQGVSYFYGLFSDEDPKYIEFHQICNRHFNELTHEYPRVNKTIREELLRRVRVHYSNDDSPIIAAMNELLHVFLERFSTDYREMKDDDKVQLIRETVQHRTLKQSMDSVQASVTITTIHGSKGLEWDYVVIPDMEKMSFPNYFGMCGQCTFQYRCDLVVNDSNEEAFLSELSLFYVAVTRAKNDVVFSASKMQIRRDGREVPTNVSCLVQVPGIGFRT